jgi:aminoglycoside phosphotransferase (APT) family kinase protein
VIYTYIAGKPIGSQAERAAVHTQLAQAYARLHSTTSRLRSPLPRQSAFEMNFAADLRRGLTALDSVSADSRLGQQRLCSMLLPRRNQIQDWLSQAVELHQQAVQYPGPLVLCHTDMGGNNVLLDQAGQIHILDWDGLILAPPEHDLAEQRGPGFADFLDQYWRAGGVYPLDPLQFAFYLKRRYLADLTDWLIRILEEFSSSEQDENDLYWLEHYCLNSLENFDAEMAELYTLFSKD